MVQKLQNNNPETGYGIALTQLWGSYKGVYKDRLMDIASAYNRASKDQLFLYRDAIDEVQQIESQWEEFLKAKNGWKLIFGKSAHQIHEEGKQKRESSENRIGIYFGRLLELGANEEDLEIFLENLLFLETSLYPEEVLDSFADGFVERMQTGFVSDRKDMLEEYASNFIFNLIPSYSDSNPYSPPRSYDPVSDYLRPKSRFSWFTGIFGF